MRYRPRLSGHDTSDMLDSSNTDEVDLDDYYPESEFLFTAQEKVFAGQIRQKCGSN